MTASGNPAAASMLHLAQLMDREARIAAARRETQAQMLHNIGSAHRCGEIDDRQLCDIFANFAALATPGRIADWNAHVDITWHRMLHLDKTIPNGPGGTWVGSWPLDEGEPLPTHGEAVVYVLFGADNEPCYVGSSGSLRARLKRHAKDGKAFTRWQAHPCRDRDHAYEVEDRLLKQHRPRLNIKASR